MALAGVITQVEKKNTQNRGAMKFTSHTEADYDIELSAMFPSENVFTSRHQDTGAPQAVSGRSMASAVAEALPVNAARIMSVCRVMSRRMHVTTAFAPGQVPQSTNYESTVRIGSWQKRAIFGI